MEETREDHDAHGIKNSNAPRRCSTTNRAKRPDSFLLGELRGPRLFLRVKTLAYLPRLERRAQRSVHIADREADHDDICRRQTIDMPRSVEHQVWRVLIEILGSGPRTTRNSNPCPNRGIT